MKQIGGALIGLVVLVIVAAMIVLCFLFFWGTLIGIAIGCAALMVLIWPLMGIVWIWDWVESRRFRRTMADLAKVSKAIERGNEP